VEPDSHKSGTGGTNFIILKRHAFTLGDPSDPRSGTRKQKSGTRFTRLVPLLGSILLKFWAVLHSELYQLHHIVRAAPLADLPLLQGAERDVQGGCELRL